MLSQRAHAPQGRIRPDEVTGRPTSSEVTRPPALGQSTDESI